MSQSIDTVRAVAAKRRAGNPGPDRRVGFVLAWQVDGKPSKPSKWQTDIRSKSLSDFVRIL
ncbi:hypothetical protein ALQ90_03688 [Pseudomonas savastanoi pv. savastanoi]|uniref:Uncharacterized protein n=1 Tax=Pseudomonas syringae pv. pisi TaxID=59510 RepID=A0A3M3TQQ9_PSESJ|nr:hypothetical protein ALQ90_03688 [Pseudomonas savastanoi pv. savastanoi]RMO23110.1 hypothetical protein ALQ44_00577 [Pseudomonas syringae pv. pisi]